MVYGTPWTSTAKVIRVFLTRWRRYEFGIRTSFVCKLLLCGDISSNPGPANCLKIAFFNARRLVNKASVLEAEGFTRKYDNYSGNRDAVRCFSLLFRAIPSNFNVFPKDRDRRGGGVLIAINGDLICHQRVPTGLDAELSFLDIHYSKNK